jgi:hypothetical protein
MVGTSSPKFTMKIQLLVPALTLLSVSAALAISHPLTPPPVGDLGIDFRTRAFSSINGKLPTSNSNFDVSDDQFIFSEAGALAQFTWSPRFGIGTDRFGIITGSPGQDETSLQWWIPAQRSN